MDEKRRGTSYVLGELTWQEARQRFNEVDVALLPVGSTEQHGPHLPLDTDAFDAEHLARTVAAVMEEPRPVVLPVVSYGVSYHHMGFCGTISLSNETLTSLIYEIGMSLAKHGIKKLVIVNGHGGNGPALQNAAQMINRDARIFACVDTGETSDVDVRKIIETPNDAHAGELETSTALAARPELVRMHKARKSVPRFSSRYLNFSTSRSVEWYTQTEKISRSGVLGDPTKANREKGERLWKIMVEHLVSFVDDLRNLTLDEIYERKY
jgi:creatinine amidohydrolase/Fe(II)-dependent formamide hydrolase-like protein